MSTHLFVRGEEHGFEGSRSLSIALVLVMHGLHSHASSGLPRVHDGIHIPLHFLGRKTKNYKHRMSQRNECILLIDTLAVRSDSYSRIQILPNLCENIYHEK